VEAAAAPSRLRRTRSAVDRVGDRLLYGLTAAATILSLLVVAAIAWKVIDGAWPAVTKFGLGFLWAGDWNPVTSDFGALWFIIGTVVTSFVAVLLAAPVSIAIGLFLSELAPPTVRGPIGTLVEMLAAVPSVVIGLWGIFVLGPFTRDHIEPALQSALGFLPIFSGTPSQAGMLPAIFVLTIMIIPITSSICRELFVSVPEELEEAAIGLGATRWEMVKGVVLSSVKGGVVAAVILGLGRALGEAIAVTQTIGNFVPLSRSLFAPGDTLASRVANQYQGAVSNIQVASLIYLGLILLVITFASNLVAQRIVHRFAVQRAGGE
jgi:phosphate transport system permease protein